MLFHTTNTMYLISLFRPITLITRQRSCWPTSFTNQYPGGNSEYWSNTKYWIMCCMSFLDCTLKRTICDTNIESCRLGMSKSIRSIDIIEVSILFQYHTFRTIRYSIYSMPYLKPKWLMGLPSCHHYVHRSDLLTMHNSFLFVVSFTSVFAEFKPTAFFFPSYPTQQCLVSPASRWSSELLSQQLQRSRDPASVCGVQVQGVSRCGPLQQCRWR